MAYILAILITLIILYKLYKKCSKRKSCCGILPNVCIKVKQNIEPSPNRIVCYNRNNVGT